jgi:Fe-S-cluster-containing dehydrogenase component
MALEQGEQYRFHFDMTKCIGCKCCVVACNEANGIPAELTGGAPAKCDMCQNRLSACVAACPEGAIAIEIVAEWRRDYLSANAPGLAGVAQLVTQAGKFLWALAIGNG